MITMDTDLADIVGRKVAKALADNCTTVTVQDLLTYYPRRYHERGEHTDVSDIEVGGQVTIVGQVAKTTSRQFKQRHGSLLEVVITDGTHSVTATFFNQAWRSKELTSGRWGIFAGKITDFRGKLQLSNPEYQLLGESDASREQVEEFAKALIPVYPATAKLPTWTIARCIAMVLDTVTAVPDPLPEQIRQLHKLAPRGIAFRDIHRPSGWPTYAAARRRLAWDEAFAVQLALVQRRHQSQLAPSRPRPVQPGRILEAFDQSLPFVLTKGQQEVCDEISADLSVNHPMHRLLQGEVGSGKTVVALRAMLQVVDNGGQAALLAPTEVLATQHVRSLSSLLGSLALAGQLGAADQATSVVLLTGSLSAPARRAALAAIASGEAGIVVGTHALLSQGVDFADLGLVVVDEQHRFGVEQRDALRAKSQDFPPHMLVMTATPIPRTVAMTVFGDLEVSALTELPSGRAPITTHVVMSQAQPHFVERVWQRVREEVDAGYRVYVVCPRIGGSDDDVSSDELFTDAPRQTVTAVTDLAEEIARGPLAGISVGVLHGKLASDDKDRVMADFSSGKVPVLVATTVIEVGVDVPEATMMVIMDADRFGISQLHQLRGRVGRGGHPGLCLLLSDAAEETPAMERLTAVASTVDGAKLAELDLQQRREGDVLGATQSGRKSQLKLLSLLKDATIINEARQEANRIIEQDPTLAVYPELAGLVEDLMTDERVDYLHKA